MKMVLGSKHVLEVIGTCEINGLVYYRCWFNGGEYQVKKYAHQYGGVKRLFCEYTGLHSNKNLTFKQDLDVVLSEIYKKNKSYSFEVVDDYVDRYGKKHLKLKDSYDFSHTVRLNEHNFSANRIDSILCKVDNIVDGRLVLSFCAVVKFMSVKELDFNEIDFNADDSLRDYQIENKRKIYEAWSKLDRVMLQMPTGTGKTRLFVSIVKDLHNWGAKNKRAVKVLILAHRKELIEQISTNVGYKYGLAHGLIVSQNQESKLYPVQVGSVPTLNRRLDRWDDKEFDVIIIDEAHHVKAMSYKNILQQYPTAKVLGVTATPYRLNGAGFVPEFEDLIISPSVAEFIKRGYLCEYDYYSIKEDSSLQKEIDKMALNLDGDYMDSEMMNVMDRDSIRAGIVETYLKCAKGKKGIVYTVNKNHNIHICNKFIEHNIKAVAIDSDTPKEKRDELVGKFRDGEVDILCNVNIFSEGFDCPDVEFIQLARPTKSLSMFLQQVGRGLRTADGKDKLIVLDNVGLYNKFGFPSARRKWRYHFEGRKGVDEVYVPTGNISDEIRDVYDIEEGNDAMDLIHSSEKEIVEEVNNMRNYKLEFISYLENKNLGRSTIEQYLYMIHNHIDRYVRNIVDKKHVTLFQIIDVELLELIYKELNENKDFIEFSNNRTNSIVAMNHYLSFAKNYVVKEKVEDDSLIEDNLNNVDIEDSLINENDDMFSKDIQKELEGLDKMITYFKQHSIPVPNELLERKNKLLMLNNKKLIFDDIKRYIEKVIKENNILINSFYFTYKVVDGFTSFSPINKELVINDLEGLEQSIELFKKLGLKVQQDILNKKEELKKSAEFCDRLIDVRNGLKDKFSEYENMLFGVSFSQCLLKLKFDSGEIIEEKIILENIERKVNAVKEKVVDKKTIRYKLRVTFDDGLVLCFNRSKDTLVECVKMFGVEKVKKLDLYCNGIPFIDNKLDKMYESHQVEIAKGLYINTCTDTETKAAQILKIAELLKENVKVELIDKETGSSSVVDYSNRSFNAGGRKSQYEVCVIFPDGRIVKNNWVADTLQEIVEYAGVENVKNLNINASGIPLVSTTLDEKYGRNQRKLSNGMYLMTNTSTETKIKQIKEISTAYSLGLKVEQK